MLQTTYVSQNRLGSVSEPHRVYETDIDFIRRAGSILRDGRVRSPRETISFFGPVGPQGGFSEEGYLLVVENAVGIALYRDHGEGSRVTVKAKSQDDIMGLVGLLELPFDSQTVIEGERLEPRSSDD